VGGPDPNYSYFLPIEAGARAGAKAGSRAGDRAAPLAAAGTVPSDASARAGRPGADTFSLVYLSSLSEEDPSYSEEDDAMDSWDLGASRLYTPDGGAAGSSEGADLAWSSYDGSGKLSPEEEAELLEEKRLDELIELKEKCADLPFEEAVSLASSLYSVAGKKSRTFEEKRVVEGLISSIAREVGSQPKDDLTIDADSVPTSLDEGELDHARRKLRIAVLSLVEKLIAKGDTRSGYWLSYAAEEEILRKYPEEPKTPKDEYYPVWLARFMHMGLNYEKWDRKIDSVFYNFVMERVPDTGQIALTEEMRVLFFSSFLLSTVEAPRGYYNPYYSYFKKNLPPLIRDSKFMDAISGFNIVGHTDTYQADLALVRRRQTLGPLLEKLEAEDLEFFENYRKKQLSYVPATTIWLHIMDEGEMRELHDKAKAGTNIAQSEAHLKKFFKEAYLKQFYFVMDDRFNKRASITASALKGLFSLSHKFMEMIGKWISFHKISESTKTGKYNDFWEIKNLELCSSASELYQLILSDPSLRLKHPPQGASPEESLKPAYRILASKLKALGDKTHLYDESIYDEFDLENKELFKEYSIDDNSDDLSSSSESEETHEEEVYLWKNDFFSKDYQEDLNSYLTAIPGSYAEYESVSVIGDEPILNVPLGSVLSYLTMESDSWDFLVSRFKELLEQRELFIPGIFLKTHEKRADFVPEGEKLSLSGLIKEYELILLGETEELMQVLKEEFHIFVSLVGLDSRKSDEIYKYIIDSLAKLSSGDIKNSVLKVAVLRHTANKISRDLYGLLTREEGRTNEKLIGMRSVLSGVMQSHIAGLIEDSEITAAEASMKTFKEYAFLGEAIPKAPPEPDFQNLAEDFYNELSELEDAEDPFAYEVRRGQNLNLPHSKAVLKEAEGLWKGLDRTADFDESSDEDIALVRRTLIFLGFTLEKGMALEDVKIGGAEKSRYLSFTVRAQSGPPLPIWDPDKFDKIRILFAWGEKISPYDITEHLVDLEEKIREEEEEEKEREREKGERETNDKDAYSSENEDNSSSLSPPVLAFAFSSFDKGARKDLWSWARERDAKHNFILLDKILMAYLSSPRFADKRQKLLFQAGGFYGDYNPYLRAYEAGAAGASRRDYSQDLLFGRKEELREIRERKGYFFVMGGGGQGKSSLLAAFAKSKHFPNEGQYVIYRDIGGDRYRNGESERNGESRRNIGGESYGNIGGDKPSFNNSSGGNASGVLPFSGPSGGRPSFENRFSEKRSSGENYDLVSLIEEIFIEENLFEGKTRGLPGILESIKRMDDPKTRGDVKRISLLLDNADSLIENYLRSFERKSYSALGGNGISGIGKGGIGNGGIGNGGIGKGGGGGNYLSLREEDISSRDDLRTLLSAISSSSTFKVVFSTSLSMGRLLYHPLHPFRCHTEPLFVGPLSQKDALDLITVPLSLMGFSFDKASMAFRIAALALNQPALINLINAGIIERMNRDYLDQDAPPPFVITDSVIAEVINDASFKREYRDYFGRLLFKDSEDPSLWAIYVVITYADFLDHKEAVSIGQLLALLRESYSDFREIERDELIPYMEELRRLGLLSLDEAGYHIRLSNPGAAFESVNFLESEIARLSGYSSFGPFNRILEERRFMGPSIDGSTVPSPLTVRQEATLFRHGDFGINIIVGSGALGLNRVSNLLRTGLFQSFRGPGNGSSPVDGEGIRWGSLDMSQVIMGLPGPAGPKGPASPGKAKRPGEPTPLWDLEEDGDTEESSAMADYILSRDPNVPEGSFLPETLTLSADRLPLNENFISKSLVIIKENEKLIDRMLEKSFGKDSQKLSGKENGLRYLHLVLNDSVSEGRAGTDIADLKNFILRISKVDSSVLRLKTGIEKAVLTVIAGPDLWLELTKDPKFREKDYNVVKLSLWKKRTLSDLLSAFSCDISEFLDNNDTESLLDDVFDITGGFDELVLRELNPRHRANGKSFPLSALPISVKPEDLNKILNILNYGGADPGIGRIDPAGTSDRFGVLEAARKGEGPYGPLAKVLSDIRVLALPSQSLNSPYRLNPAFLNHEKFKGKGEDWDGDGDDIFTIFPENYSDEPVYEEEGGEEETYREKGETTEAGTRW
jgi:hypothetical protein